MAESVEEQDTRAVLQISGFINGYGPTIGLQQFDYILGVDGTPFLGTANSLTRFLPMRMKKTRLHMSMKLGS